MQFIPRLRPDSRVVVQARSRKLPAIQVGGVVFHWSGAARTYVGPIIADTADLLHEPDVQLAAVADLPPLVEDTPAPVPVPTPAPPPIKKSGAATKKADPESGAKK